MGRQAITVELPEEVYERVQRTARGMQQTLEQALARIVTAAMPSLERGWHGGRRVNPMRPRHCGGAAVESP